MPVTQKEIDDAQATVDALKQQQINESEAPVSKQFVEDVMNGVDAPITGNAKDPAVDCAKMKAKGIVVDIDSVDGQWCIVTLPIGAPSPDNAFLHGFAAELQLCGGQRIDLNGDTGPIEIRCHHKKVARLIYDYESRL